MIRFEELIEVVEPVGDLSLDNQPVERAVPCRSTVDVLYPALIR